MNTDTTGENRSLKAVVNAGVPSRFASAMCPSWGSLSVLADGKVTYGHRDSKRPSTRQGGPQRRASSYTVSEGRKKIAGPAETRRFRGHLSVLVWLLPGGEHSAKHLRSCESLARYHSTLL